jgi:hypothetical protein
MNKMINRLIRILKEQVNQNNREIRLNQEEIERMLSGNAGGARQRDLDAINNVNRQLQEENTDFMRLQQELSEFLLKYDYLDAEGIAEVQQSAPVDQVLLQTVNGKLEYNPAHPQFNDPEFFHRLLKYYENMEDYEMCDKLLRLRKTL